MPEPLNATLQRQGAAIARGALPLEAVAAWRAAATVRYAEVDALIEVEGPWRVAERLGVRFAPTASSLGLESLGEVAAGIPRAITDAVGGVLEAALGGATRPLLESSWLRRQVPPATAPKWHAPHAWHQDGALGFDFLGDAPFEGGLLPMIVCWCPLVPCGQDAPGVTFVAGRRALMSPEALRGPHGAAEVPALRPGDVLMMTGDVLHRTHVHEGMTRDRLSVGVRFVPAGHPGRRGPWSGTLVPRGPLGVAAVTRSGVASGAAGGPTRSR